MKNFKGIGASEGISRAKVYVLDDSTPVISKKEISNIEEEILNFEKCLETTKTQIEEIKNKTLDKLGAEKAAIFDAHIGILLDPELINQIKTKINEKVNASFAVQEVAEGFKQIFLSMDDEYMRERAADISDVTSRLVKVLEGIKIADPSAIDEEVIIVAHDITPSVSSQLEPEFVKGFITEIGGRTSHSAIMARSLEIPAIVGVGKDVFTLEESEIVVMDGSTGEFTYKPDTETDELFSKRKEAFEEFKEKASLFIDKDSKTIDGWKTKVAANIGTPADLQGVKENGAEGVGLFRSEFLYMDSEDWPTEEEQFAAYKEVVETLSDQKVVIRTLDIGGDKILKYFKFEEEMNPFLGYRAIRLQLDKQELLITQARALLRASAFGKLAINIPMIATIEEFRMVKEIFKKVEKQLSDENIEFGDYELGIMVEAPAAVALADIFAKEADFFSIGSNDLIQYTFAADRMSQKVSYLYQPLNPSILRMVKQTIDASHKEGKWTAICGEMAGEPLLTPILVGMGLDEFSMSATSVLKIRKLISEIDKKEAEELVEQVLSLATEKEVKEAVETFLEKRNILIV